MSVSSAPQFFLLIRLQLKSGLERGNARIDKGLRVFGENIAPVVQRDRRDRRKRRR